MISLTVDQQASLASSLVTVCRCWIIIRKDGKILRLTDHDRTLEVGEKNYSPINSLTTSATVRAGGLKDKDVEIRAALDSDRITEADLLAGLYRDAKVCEFLVDWRAPENGAFVKSVFWIENTQSDGEVWLANIGSLTNWANQPFGANYSRDCQNNVGDDACGVDLEAIKESGEITAVTSDPGSFTVDITGSGDEFFKYGWMKFTGGLNAGFSYPIKTLESSSGDTVLYLEPIFNVEVGDTVDAYPGCDRTKTTCKDKFDNIPNFNGFPYLVGKDRMFLSPDAKD